MDCVEPFHPVLPSQSNAVARDLWRQGSVRPWLLAYAVLAGILSLILAGIVGIWASHLYWLHSPPGFVDFGATPQQCLAAFHTKVGTTTDKAWASPLTRTYCTGGWVIAVGFDEDDRTEQFMYSKSPWPDFSELGPAVSEAEQQTLLERYKGDSAWQRAGADGERIFWRRADEQAFASYLGDKHRMVVINQQSMDRHMKALPGHGAPSQ